MDLLALGVVGATVFAVLSGAVFWRKAALQSGWRSAAEQLGLSFRPGSVMQAPMLSGRVGQSTVLVEVVDSDPRGDAHGHLTTRVRSLTTGLPADFRVRRQSAWRRFWGKPAAVGDAFDRQVWVDGNPTFALVALTPSVQGQLQRLTGQQGHIADRQVELRVPGRVHQGDRLVKLVQFVAELADALAVPPSAWSEALRQRAASDPAADIRARCLEALVREYPSALPTRAAVVDGLSDEAPTVSLVAARHAGSAGIAVAARLFQDPESSPEIRCRALRTWAALAPPRDHNLRRGLAAALTSEVEDVLCAGAFVVAKRAERGLRLHVLRALAGPPSVQAAALAALGAVGDDDDLKRVASFLSAPYPVVRAAAAKSVAKLGGVEMVAPLLKLAGGFAQPKAVKAAATAAVAAIQARTSAERGALAVVDAAPESDRGAVSTVNVGALSPAECTHEG